MASTATPIAWPTCRWTLNKVVARPVCATEIAASAAVWAGAIENPKNIPVPNISTGMAQPTSAGPSAAISEIGTAAASRPPTISRRGPTRRYRRDDVWMPAMPPRASGKVDKPECRAE